MSRTIRFRLWRYCHSERRFKYYYLGSPYLCVDDNTVVFGPTTEFAYCDDNCQPLVAPDALEQFTGIKDYDGRAVYEGDVVQEVWKHQPEDQPCLPEFATERPGNIGLVRYTDDSCRGGSARAAFQVVMQRGGAVIDYVPLNLWMGTSGISRWWRVIGNVHENPELLPTT